VDEAGMKNLKSMQYLENIVTDIEDQTRGKSMNDETKNIKKEKSRRNGLKNSSILVVFSKGLIRTHGPKLLSFKPKRTSLINNPMNPSIQRAIKKWFLVNTV